MVIEIDLRRPFVCKRNEHYESRTRFNVLVDIREEDRNDSWNSCGEGDISNRQWD